ncbi:MAG: Hsp20/alpha crystallin family protein [Thermodesulfobacteriota bacterium]
MKGLIPWERRQRGMTPFRNENDREDLFNRFFSMPMHFGQSLFSDKGWYPSVDVSEGDQDIIVKAEIPGVDRKDIDISLEGRLLTIKGEKKHEKEESCEHYHRVENSFGYYRRTIDLPAEVDSSDVDATYKNGILKLKLKKGKSAETRTIRIKTG